MKAILPLFVTLMTLLFHPSVFADTDIITANDPELIHLIAKSFGEAELSEDRYGDPIIYAKIADQSYQIDFYGCNGKGQQCKSILFNKLWNAIRVDAGIKELNDWNSKSLFGRAYFDVLERTINIELSVNLDQGVTAENMIDTFDWWRTVLEDFTETIFK